MNIYERVIEKLTVFEIFQFWPEIDIVLRRAVGPQPPYWQLPILACEAVGSPGDAAIPAVAAIACLQTSIILVDDLLDNDPRGSTINLEQPLFQIWLRHSRPLGSK